MASIIWRTIKAIGHWTFESHEDFLLRQELITIRREAERWKDLARMADAGHPEALENALPPDPKMAYVEIPYVEREKLFKDVQGTFEVTREVGSWTVIEKTIQVTWHEAVAIHEAMWRTLSRSLDAVRPDRTKPECTFKGVHTSNECNGTHDHNDGRGLIDYRKERSK